MNIHSNDVVRSIVLGSSRTLMIKCRSRTTLHAICQNDRFCLKYSISLLLLSLLLLVCQNVLFQSVQCQFVEIQTELGRIKGVQMRSYFNNPAIGFMGIPYAMAPIGSRRFKKPIPQPKWSPKTLMATGYQSCCPQLDINGLPHGDEDCLYLNVFVPLKNIEQDQFSTGGKRLPVMVYIQGESFENGDAALYGAEHLLDWDVILVTFNYRLGILGFLSTDDEHSTGNWGLYDQLLVLKWIHDHIESFSGDPSQVTIFGQGAGASSTILHLISPLSTGLFNRVIAQSGSPLCSWSMENNPQSVALELGRKIGCPTRQGNGELVRCLRTIQVANLLKAQQQGKIFGEYPHQFVPVIEDVGVFNERLVPEDPRVLISQGHYKRIPLVMGYNRDETSFLYPLILNRKMFADSGNMRAYLEEKLLPRFIRATILDENSRNYDIIKSNVFKFKSTLKDSERDIQQNILFKYFNFLNSKNYTDMASRFVNMSTDALYGSCIDETLRLYSAATTTPNTMSTNMPSSQLSSGINPDPANRINFLLPFANITYKYVFSYRGRNSMLNLIMNGNHFNYYRTYTGDFIFSSPSPSSSSSSLSSSLMSTNNDLDYLMNAVCHGDELFYLFSLKFSSKKPPDNRDQLIQNRMLHLWTDFAKHGFTPYAPSLDTPFWPPFTNQRPFTYLIEEKLNILDRYRDWATHFWIRYLPAISSTTISSSSASIIHKPSVNTAGGGGGSNHWQPTTTMNHNSKNNYQDLNSLSKLRTFAWSMLALSLILFSFVIILMLLLFYQRRKQSFSAATADHPIPTGYSPGHTTPKTLAQILASRRTSISGLY